MKTENQAVQSTASVYNPLKLYGFTVEELQSVSQVRVDTFVKNALAIPGALRVITRQQLLGLDKKPLVLPDMKSKVNCRTTVVGYGDVERGDFHCWREGTVSTVYYHCRTTNKNLCATISIEKLDTHKLLPTHEISVHHLVHDWHEYRYHEGKHEIIVLYSPCIPEIMKYTMDEGFPADKIDSLLPSYQFFKEKAFLKFLNKRGLSIDQARETQGYTQGKLDVLCTNELTLERFIDFGFDFNSIPFVDENRLMFVLIHFDDVLDALKFVSISDILPANKPSLMVTAYRSNGSPDRKIPVEEKVHETLELNCSIL